MRKINTVLYSIAVVGLLTGCNGNNSQTTDNMSDSIVEVEVQEEVYVPASEEGEYTPGVDYSEGVIGSANNGDDRTSQGADIDYLESVGHGNGPSDNTYNQSDYYGD